MKRTLTLMLTALLLCTLLFGCGQKSGDGDPQDTNTEPALPPAAFTPRTSIPTAACST